MPDEDSYIGFAERLLRGRYGSWLNQPEEMALCTLNDSCTPLMWTSPYELRKATLKWERNVGGAGVAQDAALCTFHFLKLTDGDPDDSWVAGDYDSAEAVLTTFWNSIRDKYNEDISLRECTWSADGPAFTPHGSDPHPTLRVSALGDTPGSLTGQSLPPQTAITVTEVTSAKYTVLDVEGIGTQIRNRWGRFYLPPTEVGTVVDGRLALSAQNDIADAAQVMYVSAVDADLPIVMYSPTTGNAWSVDEIHVDDILDVIRSRRFITPLSRAVRSIP